MLTLALLDAVKKPRSGTPGSSATEQGFDVRAETRPNLEAYRVAVVWTEDGWRTVNYTDCDLVTSRNGTEQWTASISYYSTPPITFYFALAAAGPNGVVWSNNNGWNYAI